MCGSKRYRLIFSSLLHAQDIAMVQGYSFWREHMIEPMRSWFAFPNARLWNRSWNRNGYNCWDLLYEDLEAILNTKWHSIPELVIPNTKLWKQAWKINPHNPSFDLENQKLSRFTTCYYPLFHWFFHLFFAAAAPTVYICLCMMVTPPFVASTLSFVADFKSSSIQCAMLCIASHKISTVLPTRNVEKRCSRSIRILAKSGHVVHSWVLLGCFLMLLECMQSKIQANTDLALCQENQSPGPVGRTSRQDQSLDLLLG